MINLHSVYLFLGDIQLCGKYVLAFMPVSTPESTKYTSILTMRTYFV